ncbi:MAG: SRPBCC domain-containing protein [Cytophagaceae bacterium]
MTKDFTKSFLVNLSAPEVFHQVIDARAWWSGLFDEEFTGSSNQLNKEFEFRAGDGLHYTKQKLVEVIPNQKVVWLVTESNLSFLQHPEEWVGTKLIFDIVEEKGKIKVTFTHQGLHPKVECYDACAPAWTQYLEQKLLPLLNSVKQT